MGWTCVSTSKQRDADVGILLQFILTVSKPASLPVSSVPAALGSPSRLQMVEYINAVYPHCPYSEPASLPVSPVPAAIGTPSRLQMLGMFGFKP